MIRKVRIIHDEQVVKFQYGGKSEIFILTIKKQEYPRQRKE